MSLVPCSFGGLCQEGRSLSGRGSLSVAGLCREGGSMWRFGGVLCQDRSLYGGRANGTRPTGMLSFFKNQFIHSNWTTNTLCLGPQNISMLCIRWSYGWKNPLRPQGCIHSHNYSMFRSRILDSQPHRMLTDANSNPAQTPWLTSDLLNHIYCIIHVNVRSLSSC